MTKAEARKLGTEEGKDRGERIWTETSPQRLATVAEKYRHKKNWDLHEHDYMSTKSVWNKSKKQWDTTRIEILHEHRAAFKKAYVEAGVEIIEENVQHAIKSGWLQELR